MNFCTFSLFFAQIQWSNMFHVLSPGDWDCIVHWGHSPVAGDACKKMSQFFTSQKFFLLDWQPNHGNYIFLNQIEVVLTYINTRASSANYLNQCWDIVNSDIGSKAQLNFKQNSYISIQENTFENIVSKMSAILSRPQCVKDHQISTTWDGNRLVVYLTGCIEPQINKMRYGSLAWCSGWMVVSISSLSQQIYSHRLGITVTSHERHCISNHRQDDVCSTAY